MKKQFSFIFLLLMIGTSYAQTKVYNMPKSITTDHSSFTFEKVKSSTSSYYINYKAKNTGNGYLIIDRNETALSMNEGEVRPTKTQYVLKPGDSKTIYNEFRAKPPVKANADQFFLQMKGIRYAKAPGTAVKTEPLTVAEKVEKTYGNFHVKVMEHNVYSDRVYVQVKCSFQGKVGQLGYLDLSKVNVSGGEPKIVKKGDIIFPNKSYTFSMNITPNGEAVVIDWADAIQVLQLEEVSIENVDIRSTTYVEKKEEVKEEPKEEKKEVAKDCEMSFADFSKLKNDIKAEMNAGGKSVEMANEFLMEKGCISTAQVVDLMGVFNLDGKRLAFAKMAFEYTSDKSKYHMAVGKLSYVKNKEALEEFLGHQ
ncbi:DUF4476 domain-containing protein [Flammeovirga aprica]|uniref:DUF4476 domain-containing protein n=1 Tax=Flammeovirga aprica JL-4 TaxID=694437 RepID=A0A7X9RYQ2_9BACT|nr:DUF4476 domain-containing protein [Flammeovirga aprica]NME71237.1 DUF4476 domain-containing protein [Flammeovirga aprica JL-4]